MAYHHNIAVFDVLNDNCLIGMHRRWYPSREVGAVASRAIWAPAASAVKTIQGTDGQYRRSARRRPSANDAFEHCPNNSSQNGLLHLLQ